MQRKLQEFKLLPETESDFSKARRKAFINEIQNFLNPENAAMISFKEVRQMLKPQNETYIGLQTIPIAKIIGSEGRWKDFDNQFFPKNAFMRERWIHVDEAAINNIILPPIKVYELGGLYFVRDGNHRVSVAKAKGIEFIDADVVSLQTEIKLKPIRTLAGMIKHIVGYEKRLFYFETSFGDITDYWCLDFSTPGQYDTILSHILTHKYFINQNREEEISMEEAVTSWFENVYMPVIRAIEKYQILRHIGNSTESDLYIWIIKFYDDLKKWSADDLPLDSVVSDISHVYKWTFTKRILNAIKKRLLKKEIGVSRKFKT